MATLLARVVEWRKAAAHVHCVYEVGPIGFALARLLAVGATCGSNHLAPFIEDARVVPAIPEVQSNAQFPHSCFCLHKARDNIRPAFADQIFAPTHSYWFAPW